MFTTINSILSEQQPEYQLNAAAFFTQLEVTATADALPIKDLLPVLTLQLHGNAELFTCYLHPVPGTDTYASLDVLAAARQIPNLKDTVFTRLHISCKDSQLLQEDLQLQLVCKVAE